MYIKRAACIGGGVASLLFSILLKKRSPQTEVHVFEKARKNDNSGWGLILNESLLSSLRDADSRIYTRLTSCSTAWSAIDIKHRGEKRCLSNQPGRSIWRFELISILREEADALGVRLHYQCDVELEQLRERYNLIICGDGSSSAHRDALHDGLVYDTVTSRNRFIWLACTEVLQNMAFDFRETTSGPIWVHAYPFARDLSTFVVECPETTYRGLGFGRASIEKDVAAIHSIFSDTVGAGELKWLFNHPVQWRTFKQIRSAKVGYGNVVLLGDAANTAHFSIGCGTRLAIEDAIALNQCLANDLDLHDCLQIYEQKRMPALEHVQTMALRSMRWFESIEEKLHFPIDQFVRSFLFRSIG